MTQALYARMNNKTIKIKKKTITKKGWQSGSSGRAPA
jgi:hypothetical protein